MVPGPDAFLGVRPGMKTRPSGLEDFLTHESIVLNSGLFSSLDKASAGGIKTFAGTPMVVCRRARGRTMF